MFLPVSTLAQKLSFPSANLYLKIPNNFEKSSNGIMPETLVRLRLKGPSVQPVCSIAHMPDQYFSNMSTADITNAVNQLNGKAISSFFAEGNEMFKSAKLTSSSHTYWSGYRSIKFELNIDMKYMGIEGANGPGYYSFIFTINNRGMYYTNCGHSNRSKAQKALNSLIPNIIISDY